MKKLLSIVALLLACSVAQAAPVQTVLGTTAKATRKLPAPTMYYGLDMVIQLPVGIKPVLDPAATGQNTVDPASIVLANTSKLQSGTLATASYTPSQIPTEGDTVSLALVNMNGINFGTIGSLWCEYKPGYVIHYNADSSPANMTFKVLSYKLFDSDGDVIPTNQGLAVINKTYVWN